MSFAAGKHPALGGPPAARDRLPAESKSGGPLRGMRRSSFRKPQQRLKSLQREVGETLTDEGTLLNLQHKCKQFWLFNLKNWLGFYPSRGTEPG
jgi:hypothetical protein